jgi:hypothetical protein
MGSGEEFWALNMKPKSLLGWMIGIAVVVVIFLAAFAYYRLNEQLRSEYETIRVVEMLEDYVANHDGNWPSSWQDLDATETAKQLSSDSSYYRRYTAVNFSLLLKEDGSTIAVERAKLSEDDRTWILEHERPD